MNRSLAPSKHIFLTAILILSCSITNAAPRPTPTPKNTVPKPTPSLSGSSVRKPKATKPQTVPPKAGADSIVGDLTHMPSGAGVVIGEPIVLASEGEEVPLGEFGAACSRWLQFHVGGQGEVGKTPLWSSVEATRREMHKADFRLAKSNIKQVAHALGVTHIAIGTIKRLNEPEHYLLQYRLFGTESAAAKPELTTLSLVGTRADILLQLPRQAKILSRTLGVKTPHCPDTIELLPEEMLLMGRGGWTFGTGLSPEDFKQLHEIATREPLAALLSLEYEARTDVQTEWQYELEGSFFYDQSFSDSQLVREMVDILMAKAGENALSLAEICVIDINQLNPYKTQLFELPNKYLYNYAFLVVASKWCIQKWGDYKQSTQMAHYAIQCAPKNPYAWLLYGERLRDEAANLRKGRYSYKITEKEWKFLNLRYEQQQYTTRKAATLDPENSKAWHNLAEAALFAGNEVVADGAFWKAYKLDPENLYDLKWGLEMYQPKWIGDTEKLAKVVALASKPKNLAWIYPEVASTLNAIDEEEQAKNAQQVAVKELESLYLPSRKNNMALARLVNPAFGASGRWGGYTGLIAHFPKSALALWLAALDRSRFDPKTAAMYYRMASKLDPRNPVLVREAASMLSLSNQEEEAITEFLAYLKDYPIDWSAHNELAWSYYKLDKTDLALTYYNKTLEMNPTNKNPLFFYCLCDLQTRTGQLDQAIENGRKAIKYCEEYEIDKFRTGWAHAFYAWALFKKGKITEARAESKFAINISGTTNPAAHQCLGEIYQIKGDIVSARAEWEQVLIWGKAGNPGPRRDAYYVEMAKAMLDKYPAPDTKPLAPTD